MSEHDADWLGSLNAPQREAVEHVHGPLLVLAGIFVAWVRIAESNCEAPSQ